MLAINIGNIAKAMYRIRVKDNEYTSDDAVQATSLRKGCGNTITETDKAIPITANSVNRLSENLFLSGTVLYTGMYDEAVAPTMNDRIILGIP
ncbi:hypothetical protein FACS1894184_15480 [Clostridia bacterium]|nr:hypothetical protein FACS1894184_15480 [Clostridia bacterium]